LELKLRNEKENNMGGPGSGRKKGISNLNTTKKKEINTNENIIQQSYFRS